MMVTVMVVYVLAYTRVPDYNAIIWRSPSTVAIIDVHATFQTLFSSVCYPSVQGILIKNTSEPHKELEKLKMIN